MQAMMGRVVSHGRSPDRDLRGRIDSEGTKDRCHHPRADSESRALVVCGALGHLAVRPLHPPPRATPHGVTLGGEIAMLNFGGGISREGENHNSFGRKKEINHVGFLIRKFPYEFCIARKSPHPLLCLGGRLNGRTGWIHSDCETSCRD